MRPSTSEIQDNSCSNYDQTKLCSFDVEFIDAPTKPLLHQKARFLYFLKGSGEIKINETAYEISPKTMVAILPWESSEITRVDEPLQFYKIIYNFDFVARALRVWYNSEHELANFQAVMEECPVLHVNDRNHELVLILAKSLREEIGLESIYEQAPEEPLSGVFVTNRLVELTVRYFRRAMELKKGKPEEVPAAPDNCRLIFKYLYAHLSERLTLSKLSMALYMSESSISKCITAATAHSFNDVLSEMRLTKATEILTHTDMTLSQVAELCGFTDAPHLAKTFAAQMGVTANEYRKLIQQRADVFSEQEKSVAFEIIDYIYQNYSDPTVNLKTVTERFRLSAKEVNKLLLFYVEKNFEDFLHYLRINQACQYLLTTQMSLLEVAIEVGYNNMKTFDRNFIKLKGTSPGNFRKTTSLQIGGESIAKK